jgi:hypothetical protein
MITVHSLWPCSYLSAHTIMFNTRFGGVDATRKEDQELDGYKVSRKQRKKPDWKKGSRRRLGIGTRK